MSKYNTIGVDLAKNVIQICVVSPTNKELQNKELTRKKFVEFLLKQKPVLVTFEACATALSNHMHGLLMEFGLVIPRGFSSLYKNIPWILEDGENELPSA